jgi:hypothetical protein
LRIDTEVGVNTGVGNGSSAERRSGQRLCGRRWEGMPFQGCRLYNLALSRDFVAVSPDFFLAHIGRAGPQLGWKR